MERKDFLKKFAVGGSILFAAPALFNACSDGTDEVIDDKNNNNNPPPATNNDIIVDLNHADFAALKTVGGFAYKGEIIIIRSSDIQYLALSKVCTHEGCTVEYTHDNTELICGCHQSKFTTTGSVTSGPAPTSLKKYSATVVGDTLKIS